MPTCGECINESLSCRYDSATLAERIRDPLHLRDIEGRLKKMETQLARAAGNKPTKKQQQMDKRPQQQQQGTVACINRAPAFRFENGGLCIETDISEAHHFLKALFKSVDANQVEERVREVFGPIRSLNKSDHVGERYEASEHLLDYLMADDPIGDSWVDMVISSRHKRCFIMYQMVGQETISCATANLRRLASKNCKQDLLFAMSLRAFVYQHENDSHQDSEYPIQTSRGYQYMECAKHLLEECYTTSSRTTIRALLYLFNFHMYQHPEEAFRYGDLAVRMAQDLDLHKGKDTNEDDRRLWWAAYWCNLYAAVHFERPLLILDDDIQTEFPKKLPDEPLDVGYCIDYCIMSIKLLQIQKLMIDGFRTSYDSSMIFQKGKELEDHMNQWESILPPHASVNDDCIEKDTLCIELGIILNAKFQYAKIQLYQCLLDSPGPLGLIASHNCNKALQAVTGILVRNGDMLNMCTWKVIIPGLHHILVKWQKITQSSNIEESLWKLREILKSRVFMYLKESQAIIELIEDISPHHEDRSENNSAITVPEGKSPSLERVAHAHDFNPTNTHLHQVGKQPVTIPSDDPYLMQFPIIPSSTAAFPLTNLEQVKWGLSDESRKLSPKVDNTTDNKSNRSEPGYEFTTAFDQSNAINSAQTRGDIDANLLQGKWPLNTDYRWVSDDGTLYPKLLDGVKPTTNPAAITETTTSHTTGSNCWAISGLTAESSLPATNDPEADISYRGITHQNAVGSTPAAVNNGQLVHTIMMNQGSSLTPNTSAAGNQYYKPPTIPPLGHPAATLSSSLGNNTVQSSYPRAQIENGLSSTLLEASARSAPSFDSLDISDWEMAWNMFPNQTQDRSQWTRRSHGQ